MRVSYSILIFGLIASVAAKGSSGGSSSSSDSSSDSSSGGSSSKPGAGSPPSNNTSAGELSYPIYPIVMTGATIASSIYLSL
ncbi:hypothetical protein MFLAVUS_004274 [Mucor flavus]|uniref:Uncharacterized protein n=1 Tax=Mucor flavus TaxID=439312 RepID=A0ABP9YVF8_9FUNG